MTKIPNLKKFWILKLEFWICLLFRICDLWFPCAGREVGRGASLLQWSSAVRRGGAARRENVGTSNRKSDEKSDHRKPKVSLAMNINQGLGGPKTTPKGLADGQPVNIPALPYIILWKWRSLVVWAYYWIYVSNIRISKCWENSSFRRRKFKWADFLEKFLQELIIHGIRTKTDTGRQGE